MKGKFITFEGCEGVGKTRQLKLLVEYLQKNHVEYFMTREPGGNEISEQIRTIILDGKNFDMTCECEALLYAAARMQLVQKVLMPKLDEGELVICDRYVDSSFAYQGYARGLGFDFIEQINSYAMKNCMPDYTVFLNLSPKQAFMRKGGADGNDRLEQSGMEFHEKVYNGYLELAKKYSERFLVIDASGTKEETHNKVINALKDKGIIC